jgi:hypothetical protein
LKKLDAFVSIYCDQNGFTNGEGNLYDIQAELKEEAAREEGEEEVEEAPVQKGPSAQQRKRQET